MPTGSTLRTYLACSSKLEEGTDPQSETTPMSSAIYATYQDISNRTQDITTKEDSRIYLTFNKTKEVANSQYP